ncbi:lipid-A-disaccharide synthase [Acidihalobacter prosperus]
MNEVTSRQPYAPRVLIITGEASGDQHAAQLVRAVLEKKPETQFAGIGGKAMKQAGVDILVDSADLAVVGLVEVLIHYRTLRRALEQMKKRLREDQPDLLILVDYPDFNLRLAKTARELGIKVLYYISPQVWAWRRKRVFTIRDRVNLMAVVFPFELPFYQSVGVPARYVGHPLVDEAQSGLTRDQAALTLGLDPKQPIVGLFPGSRRSELQRLLPIQLEAARRLKSEITDLQFILPCASTLNDEIIQPYLKDNPLNIKIVSANFYDVIQCCDAITSASGTATLEIALMGKPLVVIYRVNPISYMIMQRLVKVDHIALCNIVAGKRIAKELIQHEATPEAIALELKRLLTDDAYVADMGESFADLKQQLGSGQSSSNIGDLTLEMLDPKI